MSQTNVEVVRALYEAWNGPDGRRAALAFIADDFEWVNPSYAVEPGTRHGHEGWSAAMDSLEAAFQFDSSEPIEFRDLGDWVLCFTTFTAKTSADGGGVHPGRIASVDAAGWQDRPAGVVPRPARSPRSRWAVGVGPLSPHNGQSPASARGFAWNNIVGG